MKDLAGLSRFKVLRSKKPKGDLNIKSDRQKASSCLSVNPFDTFFSSSICSLPDHPRRLKLWLYLPVKDVAKDLLSLDPVSLDGLPLYIYPSKVV